MLSIPGIKDLKKTLWKNLEPGMIFLGGVVINDTIPYELRDYPVLTAKLLSELSEKFKFLENREVVIAEPMKGFNARKISEDMSLIQKKLKKYQDFSSNFQSEKRKILEQLEIADPEIPILNPEFIEPVFLIKDHFNSMEIPFTIPSDGGRIPSFLSKETASIRVSELFSNVLNKKLNLPDDKEILLHIVVDYSFSMNNNNKLEIVIDTVHSFYREIS
ncbi:MAG: hypothetical protein K8R21_07690, partial [Leptospira sp.]|nr:hypothetical protein [Leptospira sp.]